MTLNFTKASTFSSFATKLYQNEKGAFNEN
jgi:hypothetical protein